MRVIAEAVQSKNLKPGDFYSEHDQAWWDGRGNGIGDFVLLRNNNPYPEGYKGYISYRITIEWDDEMPSNEALEELNNRDGIPGTK